MSSPVDFDTVTLYSGVTVVVAEVTPYGMTLTDVGEKYDGDTGTLAESGSTTAIAVADDAAALTDTGEVAASQLWLTDTDAATLDDTAEAYTPTPNGTDASTLAEGITLSVAELAAYGGTLSEVAGFAKAGTDTGTLAEDAYFGQPQTDTDAITLTDTGVVTESGVPSDATELNDDVTTVVVDDLVAEGTLTDTTASLTALGTGTDTGTLTESTSLEASGGILADDDDALTLAEAVVLTVLAVTAEDGTLAEGSALLLTHTDTAAISETAALTILATGNDTGTLGETGTVNASGGAIVVVVTSSDTITLADSGIALGAFNGKALGTVAIAVRADAVARLRRRVTTTDAELEPLAVGAGDL